MSDEIVTVRVPASRLRWLANELRQADEPFQVVGREKDAYQVQTFASATPIVDQVAGYQRKPQRAAWERGRHWTQLSSYAVTGVWLLTAVVLIPFVSWLAAFFAVGSLVKFVADRRWVWGDAYIIGGGDPRVSWFEKVRTSVVFVVISLIMLALPVLSVAHYVGGF